MPPKTALRLKRRNDTDLDFSDLFIDRYKADYYRRAALRNRPEEDRHGKELASVIQLTHSKGKSMLY
jgi:hypothetical protein